MNIYLAHPISGKSYAELEEYFTKTRLTLVPWYTVLDPMEGKDILRNEPELRAWDYSHPVATNHAIVTRDHWMVEQSHIVYTNLTSATEVSIGCVAELAWAYHLRRHVILAMDYNNIHQHAFVLEMASIVWETHEQAMEYLLKLARVRTQGVALV